LRVLASLHTWQCVEAREERERRSVRNAKLTLLAAALVASAGIAATLLGVLGDGR
jgi:hypothetical protein